ncbi:TPA: hypothetical protein OT834_003427 [Morganella morganii]|uniref:hypothetical protein n=1 Tax=Morganella morganii TaxID=582 RepID=UPI000DE6987D|nr:hypothetical protein [Morganella morganii]SSN07494.1 Uncharacterised protein [Klebsiella pneumoniae]HCT7642609.1 hypothetical protein [Morganella morganii]HCU1239770.1 hypothetical protein [Morganella morganii]
MKTFDVNGNNDLFTGNDGNIAIVSGEPAVKNVCAQYVKALRGEMLHKQDKGIPYRKTTFGRQADLPLFESAFRERMREIPQVTAVVSFRATLNDNELNYVAVLRTEYGSITLNG